MKLRITVGLIAFSFALLRNVFGQGFINLDFESATPVPAPGDPYHAVQFAPAFPGWTVTIAGAVDTNALYNNIFLDSAGIAIFDNTSSFSSGRVIEGNCTAVLMSGLGYTSSGAIPSNVTLSQTGLVPLGSKSLQFEANVSSDPSGFAVMLGGQTLSLTILGTGTNYILFGADISQWTGQWGGQTEQLAFTIFAENPHVNDEFLYLDAIHFSSESVPEPDVLGLSALACLFFNLRRSK